MTTDVIDDEMEAMLREIESIGMAPAPAPAAEVKEEPVTEAVVDTAAAAIASMKAPDPAPETESMEDLESAIAAIEAKKPVEDPDAEDIAAIVAAEAKTAAAEVVAEKPAPAAGPTPTDPENVVAAKAAAPKPAATSTSASDIIDHAQVKADISINMTDLDTAMIEHPGLQLHYALKTADARRAYERLKSGVEILEAKLDSTYREKLGDGVKKPTEAAIRNALVGDPAYSSAQAKLIDAQHIWKMCEAIESSFHSRKDILLEVARDRRKEKEGALRVMDAEHTAASAAEIRKKIVESITKK